MNSSKRSFLAVTVIATAALAAAITLAIVWVVSTYKDRQEEFAATVESALNKARQKEMDDHISASEHNGITVTVIGTDSTKEPLMFPKDILSHNAEQIASFTVYKLSGISTETGERLAAITEPTDSATGFETVSFLAAFYDRINNLGSFPNSSITIAVKATDTDTRTGRIIYSDDIPIKRPLEFSVTSFTKPYVVCTIRVENPGTGFLRRMSGIIASICLIAVILCFSYIYLLRTVFRQKTLGEIRRDLTHNITHELKTPIAAASAASEALLEYSADENPERRRRYINIIHDQLGTLSGMVGRLLDISLQEQDDLVLKTEVCNMKELLHRLCLDLTVMSAKTEATVTEEYPDCDICIPTDRFHLSAAISNILDNAVKYCTAAPHVTVRLRQLPEGGARIDIEDNGIGIPASQRSRIFEKYYRIPSGDIQNVRGFGIGLYYSRLVIERHGGIIRVSEAADGHGSVFSISLPDNSTKNA